MLSPAELRIRTVSDCDTGGQPGALLQRSMVRGDPLRAGQRLAQDATPNHLDATVAEVSPTGAAARRDAYPGVRTTSPFVPATAKAA
jgi:hypothetical protein